MNQADFEKLVSQTVNALPGEIRGLIENVEITVEETKGWLKEDGGKIVLGSYNGLPLKHRTCLYMPWLPSKISFYYFSFLTICKTDEEFKKQVHDTLAHEIGHHLGMNDKRLYAIVPQVVFPKVSGDL